MDASKTSPEENAENNEEAMKGLSTELRPKEENQLKESNSNKNLKKTQSISKNESKVPNKPGQSAENIEPEKFHNPTDFTDEEYKDFLAWWDENDDHY